MDLCLWLNDEENSLNSQAQHFPVRWASPVNSYITTEWTLSPHLNNNHKTTLHLPKSEKNLKAEKTEIGGGKTAYTRTCSCFTFFPPLKRDSVTQVLQERHISCSSTQTCSSRSDVLFMQLGPTASLLCYLHVPLPLIDVLSPSDAHIIRTFSLNRLLFERTAPDIHISFTRPVDLYGVVR